MTINTEVRAALLTTLRSIKDEGPAWPDSGICHNVAIASTDPAEVRLLTKLIATWPAKLPSEEDACTVEGCIFEYWADDNKWQNPRRLALLDWLIAQLEEQQHD